MLPSDTLTSQTDQPGKDSPPRSVPTEYGAEPRLKEYVVAKEYKHPQYGRWQVGELVYLTNSEALPWVSNNFLMPILPAMKAGIYPSKKLKLGFFASGPSEPEAATELTTTAGSTTKTSRSSGKKFLHNPLQAAVQAKKKALADESAAAQAERERMQQLKESFKKQ